MKKLGYMVLFVWLGIGIWLTVLTKMQGADVVSAGKKTTITEDTGDGKDEEQEEKKGQTVITGDGEDKEEDKDKKEEPEDQGDNRDEESQDDEKKNEEGKDSGAGKENIKVLQEEINEANEKKAELEQKKDELKKRIDSLQKKKKNINEYIQALDEEMERIQSAIDALEESIKVSSKRLSQLKETLVQAIEDEYNQYEIMKKRIKYMYENRNDSYIQVILQSHNLTDLFNRMEYMKQVSVYDANMLANYTDSKEKVGTTRALVEGELINQTHLVDELELEQNAVKILLSNKSKEVKRYQKLIRTSRENMEDTTDELEKQEEEMERLLEKQRRQNSDYYTANRVTGKASGEYGLRWPLMISGRISSHFGYRTSPTPGASTYHKGVDIAVPSGSYVLASKEGKVEAATYQSAAGNYVCISHGDGLYTYYMHCSKLLVSPGDEVEQGQVIAYSGSTGISTGPHLHFGVYVNGQYVNPLDYVSY